MSETTLQNSWAEVYRDALMESDPIKVPVRIEEAYKAIHHRALELWYAGSGDTRERRDLDAALHFLDLLRMVGPIEGNELPPTIAAITSMTSPPLTSQM